MNIFTVSFFGHRIIPEFREAEDRVEALVHALLLEKEYVEFLVGRDGDFDQIVSSAVKRQQRLVRDDNSSLIWILPYPTAELRNNMENFETYYDEIEICGSAASSHPKRRFSNSQPADGEAKQSRCILCGPYRRRSLSDHALCAERKKEYTKSCWGRIRRKRMSAIIFR